MTPKDRAQIVEFIRGYTKSDRPQLFEQGAWLDHHVNMNWEQYQHTKKERPALTLTAFLAEERQKNPWTKD